jgi:uncharacterized membrane protein YtjA (UPF0391 family)
MNCREYLGWKPGRGHISLILALATGFVGFGDTFKGFWPSLEASVFWPAFPDGIVTGLARLLFVMFLLCFIVSAFFNTDLRGDQHRR